jgi:hypothetical protein
MSKRIIYQYRATIGGEKRYHFVLADPKVRNIWVMPGRECRTKTTKDLEDMADRLDLPFQMYARYPTNIEVGDID